MHLPNEQYVESVIFLAVENDEIPSEALLLQGLWLPLLTSITFDVVVGLCILSNIKISI